MQSPVSLDARTARVLPWLVAVAFFMQTLDGTSSIPRCVPIRAASPWRRQDYSVPCSGQRWGAGWLVEYASWHWIFLVNLPVGVVGCIAAFRFMPDLKGIERVRFDSLGFVMFGAAMVLITLALEGLGEMHRPHARVMLLFSGVACLAACWLRAARIEQPLFSPALFHTRSFTVGIFGNLFARLGGGLSLYAYG